mgnify:CR=1 FL=1
MFLVRRQMSKLLEIRSIMALAVMLLFIILSITKVLQTDFIQNVILTVVVFFFAKGSNYDEVNKDKRNDN